MVWRKRRTARSPPRPTRRLRVPVPPPGPAPRRCSVTTWAVPAARYVWRRGARTLGSVTRRCLCVRRHWTATRLWPSPPWRRSSAARRRSAHVHGRAENSRRKARRSRTQRRLVMCQLRACRLSRRITSQLISLLTCSRRRQPTANRRHRPSSRPPPRPPSPPPPAPPLLLQWGTSLHPLRTRRLSWQPHRRLATLLPRAPS